MLLILLDSNRSGIKPGALHYFKYAREHFALDALDSYADQPDDPTRLVPNPAKAHAGDQVSGARAQLAAAQGGVADAIDAAGIRARQPGSGGKATVYPAAGQALTAAITDLAAAKATSATTASHLPLGQVRPAAGCWRPRPNCSPTPSG